MKKALMALLAILILGGGAGGAYYYFEQPAQAAIGETEEHKAAKDDAHAGKEGGHGKGNKFVEMDPLVLPIVDAEGVSQVVTIVVVLEVSGDRNADTALKLQPRLKDAYIQDLYGVLNRHAAMQGGVLQVGMVKERLNAISDRVLGEGVIEDVLLQVVSQRPI